MSSQPEHPAAEGETSEETPPGVNWGRVLDAAGIGAGILLIIIVADIWSDGRLISRRLHKPRPPEVNDDERHS